MALKVAAIPGAFLLYQIVLLISHKIEFMDHNPMTQIPIVLLYFLSVAFFDLFTRLLDISCRLVWCWLAGFSNYSLVPKIKPLIPSWIAGGESLIVYIVIDNLFKPGTSIQGSLLMLATLTFVLSLIHWIIAYKVRYGLIALKDYLR